MRVLREAAQGLSAIEGKRLAVLEHMLDQATRYWQVTRQLASKAYLHATGLGDADCFDLKVILCAQQQRRESCARMGSRVGQQGLDQSFRLNLPRKRLARSSDSQNVELVFARER